MFRFFSLDNLPIAKKIRAIIFSGIGISMLIALSYFILIDRNTATVYLNEELKALAEITAKRSSAAVDFQHQRNAQENLETLAIRPSIRAACIYDKTNTLFASYTREINSPYNCQPTYTLHPKDYPKQTLLVRANIDNKAGKLGELLIISDLSQINKRTFSALNFASVLLIMVFLVTFLMSSQIKKSLVTPIDQLNRTMAQVKSDNNLSLRANITVGDDEIGRLVREFNAMLKNLQDNNQDLRSLHDDLVIKSAEAETISSELEARNHQIKDLISGAAHDLRQPLQALSIFVEALGNAKDAAQTEKIIGKIQLSANNLSDLFDEILDVSKAEQLAEETELQLVNINDMMTRLQVEFHAMASEKNLDLRVHAPPVLLYTIPRILERITRNLISNAIKYTDHGGVLFACRYHRDNVSIEVWDTGRGIPEEKLQSVFKKFERVDDDDKERSSSYGLGLALVKKFTDMLGYEVEVHSKVNQGSCFRVMIPNEYLKGHIESHYFAQHHSNHTPASSVLVHNPLSPLKQMDTDLNFDNAQFEGKVLLIDDDPNIREAVKMLLESWGLYVTEIDSIAALRAYVGSDESELPDFIISDYQLSPTENGAQAIEIAQTLFQSDIPSLIITGNRSPSIQAQIKESGNAMLFKPVNPMKLKAHLFRILEAVKHTTAR